MKPRFALGVATGLALALAHPAAADDQLTEEQKQAARAHFTQAQAEEAAGNYAAAALEYGAAYEVTSDPKVFFHMGRVNQKAGKCSIALVYYKRYLKEANPQEEFRRLTEENIAGCNATLGISGGGGSADTGAGGGTGVEPDFGGGGDAGGGDTGGGDTGGGDTTTGTGGDTLGTGGPSFTDDKGASWKRSAAWISTGATIGLVAVGTVLYMSAEGSEEDIEALIDFRDQQGRPLPYDQVQDQYADLVDEGKRFDSLATYAFIGAGVGAAAAITFFVLDARAGGSEKPVGFVAKSPRVAPRLGRESAGVVLGWEF
ncbi:MAG: hypothetical protein K8M05_21590 [Deltaproteobacteria bacterium]|nr:hypothetical protein [Kofleriaceae bacterium]